MAKKVTPNSGDGLDFLDQSLPITGGNSFAVKNVIDSQSQFYKSTIPVSPGANDKYKYKTDGDSLMNCYPLWYLLQFMADYFSNLIPFRFDSQFITEQCYKAIRTSCIFGNACLVNTVIGSDKKGNDILAPIAYYIANLKTDPYGIPLKLKVYPAGDLFMNTAVMEAYGDKDKFKEEISKLHFLDLDYKPDIYILNYSAGGWGGLTKWLYFLKQLERILKMFYNSGYALTKSIIYNVSDRSASLQELDIFFSNSPFIINTGDDEILGNRFKPFELSSDSKMAIADYLNSFMEIYYALLGRRTNIDYKKERNITSEIAMSQDNYDILQNEFKTYITLMLEWVSKQYNLPIIYNDFSKTDTLLDKENGEGE